MTLKIAVVAEGKFFDDYRNALVREIEKQGFTAQGFDYINYDYKPDAFVVIGIHKYGRFKRYNDFIYCGIQTEQLPTRQSGGRLFGSDKLIEFYKHYREYDVIFEWSSQIFAKLSSTRKNIVYFPYSSFDEICYRRELTHKTWGEMGYDILFVGAPTGIQNRRAALLDRLRKNFAVYPKCSGLWGKEKELAILDSRICLNMHFEFAAYCEYPRLFEYLSNNKFMLSEQISDSAPFIDGEHFVSFYESNMIERVGYYLSKPEEASAIAEKGYRRTQEYHLSKTIHRLLVPIILEKHHRKTIDFRLMNRIFHLTGIDSTKDVSSRLYLFNWAIRQRLHRWLGR